MSRRNRRRAAAAGASESMMEFYLRNRTPIDAEIDRDVARSCTSKQAYASDAEARAIATMNGMSGSLFTYHCRYCDFWHLTRRPTSSSAPDIIDD